MEFTHLDSRGQARMVDVTAKQPTVRAAGAEAIVSCSAEVVTALREGTLPKGDVLAVARVAGIAAAKKVPDLLPLAHVIGVHGVVLDVEVVDGGVQIRAEVKTADRHGSRDGGPHGGDRRRPRRGGHGQGRRPQRRDHLGAGHVQVRRPQRGLEPLASFIHLVVGAVELADDVVEQAADDGDGVASTTS